MYLFGLSIGADNRKEEYREPILLLGHSSSVGDAGTRTSSFSSTISLVS